MSVHTFDTEVACELGLNAAVIYQSFTFWVEKNEANGKHFHDGQHWTYNSVKALGALFPYLSADQIRRAIEKLESAGYLRSGNFNETTYDRTKWFCCPRRIHLASVPNRIGENAKPIPDSKPDTDTDNDPITRERDLFGSQQSVQNAQIAQNQGMEDRFNEFWKIFPMKAGKEAARKAFKKALTKTTAESIISGARAYAAEHPPGSGFLKYPQGWLNDGRWDDERKPSEPRRRPYAAPDWEHVER